MTPKEYIKKLDGQFDKINDINIIVPVVEKILQKQVNRIFYLGKAGDDGQIGNYNRTTPVYINPKKFPIKGKIGYTLFKGGWFPSYFAFRASLGKEVGFVNLRLTELLKTDFLNSMQRLGKAVVTGVAIKDNVVKVTGNAKRFGLRTWLLTKSERKLYNDIVKQELFKVLNK